jgi:hypothetical protein
MPYVPYDIPLRKRNVLIFLSTIRIQGDKHLTNAYSQTNLGLTHIPANRRRVACKTLFAQQSVIDPGCFVTLFAGRSLVYLPSGKEVWILCEKSL